MLKVDSASTAHIITGDIFISDLNFQNSCAPSALRKVKVDCFIPYDWFFFAAWNDFGSFLLLFTAGNQFEVDVVLHLSDDVVAFVKETVGYCN